MKLRKLDEHPAWQACGERQSRAAEALMQSDFAAAAQALSGWRNEMVVAIMALAAPAKRAEAEAACEADNFSGAIGSIPFPEGEGEATPPNVLSRRSAEEAATVAVLNALRRDRAAARDGLANSAEEAHLSIRETNIEIAQVERLQRYVFGAILTVFALVVLAPTFRGEPLDYLTAFGWAFLLDLTLQSVTAALQPLAAKVKAA
ncbi:MAG: hypothetical protein IT162_07495 [Bryobacterales bacterium]|nr:hypothetical protein [Bryobacterales bacterium]